MNDPQGTGGGTGLSRRTVLQAVGATAAAYSLLGVATGAASAATDDDGPESADKLVVYPIPSGVPTNSSFSVKARTPGGEWQTVPVYRARAKQINADTGSGPVFNSSVATFDFKGTVEVVVTSAKGTIGSARIRPLSYATQYTVDGASVSFTLTGPRNLSIEIDGEIFNNLQLHANPIEENAPDPDDEDVIYFGPGLHKTTDNVVKVPSGKTVYLAGGAVLTSRVEFENVENARLIGRGVLYNSPSGVLVRYCENIEIDGVMVLNPSSGYACTIGQSKQVTIRNLHSYSHGQWGDGIDVFSSEDVLIEGVWMRNSDDCIAIYAHRWDYYGDVRNVTVRNSTLWADVAHPINVGTHGNTDNPETIENLVFSNIDILDHREPQMDYQGCIALNPGDSNLLKNVRAQDIRVEDFRWGQLINMRVMFNKSYNTSVGRGIDGVFIRNLTYTGTHANPSIMVGYDADHAIKNVTFQNLVINGKFIGNGMKKPGWYKFTDVMPAYANEHVLNTRFLNSTEATSGDAPEITSPDGATATKNQVFNYLITASGLPTKFNAEGLPKGLDIDTDTGLISGTAKDNVGTFEVTVSATNSVGTATRTVTLAIEHA
ncbi:endo-polygalacturonase [Streptomyces ipomoeae]|uniref:Endo-polygalacturonase n=1 Tax=Streptomyces ipomoeae TaxID=103232 RepID=A0AAE8VVZ6_9ACTN|nr:Ig domain-containing protein [Streptomyces ipomoeae]MDX2820510.1 glycosyl hydrolase family 28 protein [Streptomyces ipomoeae]MDX2875905.1 glycosyl hydrolase family 28 protein [Streptomyces ipomoeae]TQE20230.1 endo-polygalacturonase [Streptomyces ipomoeae]TQE20678.1 endo-polygalacturonase [Streptomyces ipomoeae]